MKKISIVITTYNRARLLEKCIESVMYQDYPVNMFEIIVVNDCSTDNTAKMLKSFGSSKASRKYSKIRVITHEKNKGEAGARNTGIKTARFEIISFLDDDCTVGRKWLRSIDSAFKKGVAGVEGMTFASGRKGAFDNYVENLEGGRYMTCNMSYRTDIIKKIGCDERLRHANRVDSDLAFSVIEGGGNIVFSSQAAAEHSVTRGKFMSKLRRKIFFMNDALLYKKHPELYRSDIKLPFEKFTPLYIALVLLSMLNPAILLGVLAVAAYEMAYRKWRINLLDFAKFSVLQAVGSFVIIASVIYGCRKYGTSLKIFLPL